MPKLFVEKNNSLTIMLSGEIDQHIVTNLKDSIDVEIEHTGKKILIFDLSNVSLMDSSGIGLILGRYKKMTSISGKIAICGASPTVKRIIELSGITKLIPYFSNRDCAQRSLCPDDSGRSETI